MTISSDYNIVVVGMGYIGSTHLLSGYEMLLGDKVATNVFGIKGSGRDLEELQARVPFEVSVNNTAEVLRERTPDIVIMCPSPTQIPIIAKEILLPYFNEMREKGGNIPDIYTFGPSTPPEFYYDLLGDDINCAKYLPSMAETFKGVPLQECGGSFLSFAPGYPFPEDRKQRAIDFSDLYGKTFLVNHAESLIGLSSKITAHTCYEICYAVSDVMSERGYEVSTSQVGSVMRAAMRNHLDLKGEGLYPSSINDLPKEVSEFVEKFSIAWFEGILRYATGTGIEPSLAKGFHAANFELWNLTAQLATREELETTTANHATKGGVNEKAIETFMDYYDGPLRNAIGSHLDKTLPISFFDMAEGMAFALNLTVHRHAYRLANK